MKQHTLPLHPCYKKKTTLKTLTQSTCHKYASVGFTEQQILEKLCKTEHLVIDTYVKFEPHYLTRIRISIENVPNELPDKNVKTLLPE